MSASEVLAVVARLAAVAVVVSACEYIAMRSLLRDDDLMSWEVDRLRARVLVVGPFATVLDSLVRYPNILALLGLRAALGATVLLAPRVIALDPLLLWTLAALLVVFSMRNCYGHDGADQMTVITFISIAAGASVGTERAAIIVLWFLALQSALSYSVAGIAKAGAAGWRDGSFLVDICATRIYGSDRVARFLEVRPGLARWGARLLIGWECSFPLVFVLPRAAAVAMIAMGVLFHIMNAFVMGLNTFLWAFVAVYPAVIYCIWTRGW